MVLLNLQSASLTLSFEGSLSPNNSTSAMRFGSDEKLRTTSIWYIRRKNQNIISCFANLSTQDEGYSAHHHQIRCRNIKIFEAQFH